jgi:hypothetical protein
MNFDETPIPAGLGPRDQAGGLSAARQYWMPESVAPVKDELLAFK